MITRILQRGKNLTQTQYIKYLTNLSTGIKDLANKPAYSNNIEVQNIVAYIDYELTYIRTRLSTGEMFMEEFIKIVDGALPSETGSTVTSSSDITVVNIAGVPANYFGAVYCGDPSRNDYVSYSSAGG